MLPFAIETQNCWDRIKQETRPVYLYGMGNGADKILNVFEKYGITVAGIFASDSHVRGHSYGGFKVQSYAEVKENVGDFAIVLSFGTKYPELIKKMQELEAEHPFYVPDTPLAGDGLFTYEYCKEHADKLSEVYHMLADDASREVFANVINFKISGNLGFLSAAMSEPAAPYVNVLKLSDTEIFVDLGAYDSDTIHNFLTLTKNRYTRIYAVEPDKDNYKKLAKKLEGMGGIVLKQAAAWSKTTKLPFNAKGGRQSSVGTSGDTVPAVSVDDMLAGQKATFIKMDIEGCELEAIWGSCNTIAKYSPKLSVAIYHRNEDIFRIPLLIRDINPNYQFYIYHSHRIPAWDTNLYAVI